MCVVFSDLVDTALSILLENLRSLFSSVHETRVNQLQPFPTNYNFYDPSKKIIYDINDC